MNAGSVVTGPITDPGDAGGKKIMFADVEHVVGVVEEGYEGFYERYDEPDEQSAISASIFLMSRVAIVANRCRINLSSGVNSSLKVVLFNPQTRNYVCVGVSEVIPSYDGRPGLQRHIEIYSSNGTNIDAHVFYAKGIEPGQYYISTPSMFFVKRKDAYIQFLGECIRSYGSSREALEKIPPLFEAAFEISNTIDGDIVDPFQLIYGGYSESDLIKGYLGWAVVDQDDRVVIQLESPPVVGSGTMARVCDYGKVLRGAKEKLRKKLWDNLEWLASELNKKVETPNS